MQTPDTLAFVREHWTDIRSLTSLAAHQNHVYLGESERGDLIVRCTSASHRTRDQIEDELSWTIYLGEQGLPVPSIRRSVSSRMIETMPLECGGFHVVVFERVPGAPLSNRGVLTESFAVDWGRLLGRMHRLSVNFQHSASFRWAGNETGILCLDSYVRQLPDELQYLADIASRLNSRARTSANYGLVHGDLQTDNVIVSDGMLYALDFDDCCLNWRLFDVATAIFGVYFDATHDRFDLAELTKVSRALIRGFFGEFPEISDELPTLREFLILRTGLLFAWSSGIPPVPRGIESGSMEWKWHLRSWSLEELRTGRLLELVT